MTITAPPVPSFPPLPNGNGMPGATAAPEENYRVDAVVLDWALPGLDGRRVREQIARRHPDLPFLVISGHASKEYEALGGIDHQTPWLAKPFTPPALLTAVKQLLPNEAPAPGS